MDTKKSISLEDKKLLIGHYPYMMQALAVALNRVPAWRLARDGKPCSLLDVFSFAKKYDETHPRAENDPSFFCVSFEGAIGYSESGLEYMTSWIFLPMEPGAERDAIVEATIEEYNKAEEEVKRQLEAETPVIPSEAKESPKPRFCRYCGTKFKSDAAKFCPSCGKPRE